MRTFIQVGKSIVNVRHIRSMEYIPQYRRIEILVNANKSTDRHVLEFVTETQAEKVYGQYSDILLTKQLQFGNEGEPSDKISQNETT